MESDNFPMMSTKKYPLSVFFLVFFYVVTGKSKVCKGQVFYLDEFY